jgi:hypothetical protein
MTKTIGPDGAAAVARGRGRGAEEDRSAAEADSDSEEAAAAAAITAPVVHGFGSAAGSRSDGPGAFAVDGIGGRPTRRRSRDRGGTAGGGYYPGQDSADPAADPAASYGLSSSMGQPSRTVPEVDFVATATLVQDEESASADAAEDPPPPYPDGIAGSVVLGITSAVLEMVPVTSRTADGSNVNGHDRRDASQPQAAEETGMPEESRNGTIDQTGTLIVHAKPLGRCGSPRQRTCAAAAAVVAIILSLTLGLIFGLRQQPAATDGDPTEEDYAEICHPDSDPLVCGCTVQPSNNRQAVIRQSDYRGPINVTVGGIPCQRWDAQVPHAHMFTDLLDVFSDLEHNYCRNPSGLGAAWCYTMDPDVEWAYCDVPLCEMVRVPVTLSPTQAPEPLPEEPSPERPSCNDDADADRPGLSFNGASNYVVIPNSTATPLNLEGSFTIQAWIRPAKKIDFITIMSNKFGGHQNPGFAFTINGWGNSNGKVGFEGTNSLIFSLESVQWDVWQHVAVSFDGTTPAMYLDGRHLVHRQEDFHGPFQVLPSSLDTKIGDLGFYYNLAFYSGIMSDLRVYNYGRTAAEIRADMDCTVPGDDPGLIAHYRFEGGGDDSRTVYDSGPNAYDGQLVDYVAGGPAFTDQGKPLCATCSNG